MVRRPRDGSTWRIGTDAEVAWIADATSIGLTITSAIPPIFEAYATVVRFLHHLGVEARLVTLGQDATPPGHQAR